MAQRDEIKIRLNSVEKIEQVLQESYDLTCKAINEIQNEMNKLISSSNLGDVTMDDKAKYANAMHNYIKDKKDAIAQKVDIAKLMSEIIKHNGDVKGALNDPNFGKATKMDLKALRGEIEKVFKEDTEITYNTKDKD